MASPIGADRTRGDLTGRATGCRLPERVGVTARAVLAGVCLAASVPPWGWWPAAFVGIALWDRLLADQPARRRATRTWLVAACWLFPGMLWMWDLTAPGYLIAAASYSGYVALAAVLVPPDAPRRWVALPAAVILAEAARWTFPFGGVPLATLAQGQADSPLAQAARVGTALAVSGLVAVVGVGLSAALAQRWRATAVAGAVVVGSVLVGWVAPRGTDVGSLDFALVQGGGPQGTRAGETDERVVFERHLDASAEIATPVDLVLWPENVVSLPGRLEASREAAELGELAVRLDAPVVVGVTEGIDAERFANASVVVLPDGSLGTRYDKVHRVPFGEYVPLRGFLERVAAGAGLPARDAVPGTGPAVLDTPAGKMAVAISWEIFFTDRARDGVQEGGEVLLNPTNGSSYWLTQVQTQQVASSQLRAIETGRWVLQAAPTGFTAVVTPEGRVLTRSDVSEREVIEGTAMRRTGETVATRFGELPTLAAAVAALAACWAVPRRRGGSPGPSARQRPENEDLRPPEDLRPSGDIRVPGSP